MRNIFHSIGFYIIYGILFFIACLPFSVLYFFSDITYYLVYWIIGYRKKTVRTNLRNSFPEYSNAHLRLLEKKFYRQFCDYFFETIKLLHISDEAIKKRMKFNHIEHIDSLLQSHKSVILCIGHYGNWEWITSIKLYLDDKYTIGQVYKTLRNKIFNRLFLKIRSRFDSVGFDKNYIFKEIIRRKRNDETMLLGFIADQSPSRGNIHYSVNFLNQKTPVFLGIEKIATKTNLAVVYLDISKPKRGYYECDFITITENPKNEEEYFITNTYFDLLEKTIRRAPENWLWTHKRWKYAN